jgi:copper chaperone CopZ
MNGKCHVETIAKFPTMEEQRRVQAAFLLVWGMGCSNCAARVRNSLLQLKGVLDAHVDHLKGQAKVVYNPDFVTIYDLLEAVRRAGGDGTHEYGAVLEAQREIP